MSFGDEEGNPNGWPEPIFPDAPTPWSEIARSYDRITFDGKPNRLGDVSLVATPWAEFNELKGESGFGIPPYFGTRPLGPNSYGAIVAMGALLGGTLAGIDYSERGLPGGSFNMVRLIKKWFASDVGADVFLSNARSRGGSDWWYDILPNILACQLSDLYGRKADGEGEPPLAALCERAIDTWREAADHLRGDGDVPEFGYKAIQLVDGPVSGARGLSARRFDPIAACDDGERGFHRLGLPRHTNPRLVCFGFPKFRGDTYESDAAGGFAYLGLYGFEHSHNPANRDFANDSLTFLDRIDYNPFYENLLPYGAYTSARMNAEFGTHHHTLKLLGDLFSTSAVRPRYGMIGKTWGATPAYGFIGSRRTTQEEATPKFPDYAFLMDTHEVAATIAPIPRYDPSTANAIGKYLSHVAHNTRYFYPAYLRMKDPETVRYLKAADDPALSTGMPFEGAQSFDPETGAPGAYGTGDALKANRHGEFKTDLGVYSGIFAGAMATLFHPTNVANIYQDDILSVDLPRPTAYPTYLFYNPYEDTKSVRFDARLARRADPALGDAPCRLYDIVSKRVVDHVGDQADLTLAPHAASVIVTIPEAEPLEVRDGRLVGAKSGTVVDYAAAK